MSITQKVRDALASLGGSASVSDIADNAGLEKSQVAPVLNALEKSGEALIDREARPFTATLVNNAGAATADATPAHRAKRKAKTPAKAARGSRNAKPPRKARKTKAPPPKKRRARVAAPRVERVEGDNVIAIDRSAALRLAVLALNPAEPITDEDRLAIAAVIRAAA